MQQDGRGAPRGRHPPGARFGTSVGAGAGMIACSFHEKVCLSRPPWRPWARAPRLASHPHSGGRAWRPVHVAIRPGLLSDARARVCPTLSCGRSLPIGRWSAGVSARPGSGRGAQRLVLGPTHPEAVPERGELAGHGDHRAFLGVLAPPRRQAESPAPEVVGADLEDDPPLGRDHLALASRARRAPWSDRRDRDPRLAWEEPSARSSWGQPLGCGRYARAGVWRPLNGKPAAQEVGLLIPIWCASR